MAAVAGRVRAHPVGVLPARSVQPETAAAEAAGAQGDINTT